MWFSNKEAGIKLYTVGFGDRPDDAAGIAGGKGKRWDIFCHNRAGPDDTAVADGHARADDNICTEPAVVVYQYGLCIAKVAHLAIREPVRKAVVI